MTIQEKEGYAFGKSKNENGLETKNEVRGQLTQLHVQVRALHHDTGHNKIYSHDLLPFTEHFLSAKHCAPLSHAILLTLQSRIIVGPVLRDRTGWGNAHKEFSLLPGQSKRALMLAILSNHQALQQTWNTLHSLRMEPILSFSI